MLKTEGETHGSAPAPGSLIPLPPFLRGSFELKTRVPIAVEPGFLLLMGYIGYMFAGSVDWGSFAERAVIAAAVAAFSVFWHECGHAAAVLAYGGRPKITLVATGGATTAAKTEPAFWRDLIVVASGPLSGYLLSLLAGGILRYRDALGFGPLLVFGLIVAKVANWYWTLLNIVPAMPFDGGNIMRILFQRFFGPAGLRRTYLLSAAVCAGVIVYSVVETDWLFALFAYMMTVSNFKTFRNLKLFTDAELAPDVQRLLGQAGALAREGKVREAYELLLPSAPILGPRNTCVLALQGCELGEYRKAAELCEPLHKKLKRDYSVAFLAARAHAGLGDVPSAARWLKQAISDGMPDVAKTVAVCRQFDAIRTDPAIDGLVSPLKKRNAPQVDERL